MSDDPRKPLGVLHSDEMLGLAWKLMCPADKESISSVELHSAVRVFFPNMSHSQFDQFVGTMKGKMSLKRLTRLLQHDSLPQDFDPVLTAFRIFDRDHSGFLTPAELGHFVSQIHGVGQLSEEDMVHMLKLADVDGDGRVSLDDFRSFLEQDVLAPPIALSKRAAATPSGHGRGLG